MSERYTIEDRPTNLDTMLAGFEVWDNHPLPEYLDESATRIAIVPDGRSERHWQQASDIRNGMELIHLTRKLSEMQNNSPAYNVAKQQEHIREMLRTEKALCHQIAWMFNENEIDALRSALKDLETE